MRRGYIMIEVCVVLAMLMSLVVIVALVISGSNRQQTMMWDEFVASELAVSALEHRRSGSPIATGTAGDPVEELKIVPEVLPGVSTRVVIQTAPEQGVFYERAIVSWQRSASIGPLTVEREMVRRAAP